MIKTLNWLTITTPFIAGFTAYNWGKEASQDELVPALVGVLAFIGLVAVWYALFQFIEFPLWMAWFN